MKLRDPFERRAVRREAARRWAAIWNHILATIQLRGSRPGRPIHNFGSDAARLHYHDGKSWRQVAAELCFEKHVHTVKQQKIVPVSYRVLLKVFEAEGYRQVREEGDHIVLTRIGTPRPVVIPKYRALPVFIIKNNLRTAGISRERYFELLARVR